DSLILYATSIRKNAVLIDENPETIGVVSALADGTYSFQVKSIDPAGNESSLSTALDVEIDASTPSVPYTPNLIPSSDTGTSDSDDETANSTPTFEISGISIGDSVVMTVGGQTISGTATGTSINLTVPVTLTDNVYLVTAKTIDVAGNESGQSNALSVDIDLQPPANPNAPDLMSDSDSGRDDADEITNNTEPTFLVTNVSNGDSLFLKLVDSGGDTTIYSRIKSTGTSSLITASTIPEGVYTVYVAAKDPAGWESDGGSLNSFEIDLTNSNDPGQPDLTSDSGVNTSDNLTKSASPSFDVSSVVSGDSITVHVGSYTTGDYTFGTTISLTFSTEIPSGTYQAYAVSTDPAGNNSTASSSLTIRIDRAIPTVPSSVSLLSADDTGFDDSDGITRNNTPSFTITGLHSTDRDSVELYFDDTSRVSQGRNSASSTTLTLTPSTQSEGTYSVTAVAIDSAGNTSAASSAFSLEIDRTNTNVPSAPDLITASDLGRLDDDDITSDDTPSFSVSSLTVNDSVLVIVGTDTLARNKVTSGTMSIESSLIGTDGTYTVWALSIDPAGNYSDVSVPLSGLEIDTEAPAVTNKVDLKDASDSGISMTDNLTTVSKPSFSVSGVESGDSLELLIDGVKTKGGVSSGTSIDFTLTSALTTADYSVTARRFDLAGNQSVGSLPLTLRIDLSSPSVPSSVSL
ncbi:MAG: hypothetical protein KAK01_04900, partial [Candidatus Marinimicrobia bacterium]|nr:hypothetical protein [Candidatus Neomarinimicrobiota bacterium]